MNESDQSAPILEPLHNGRIDIRISAADRANLTLILRHLIAAGNFPGRNTISQAIRFSLWQTAEALRVAMRNEDYEQ